MNQPLHDRIHQQVSTICDLLSSGGLITAVETNEAGWRMSELAVGRPPAITIRASADDAAARDISTSARLYSAGATGFWLIGDGADPTVLRLSEPTDLIVRHIRMQMLR